MKRNFLWMLGLVISMLTVVSCQGQDSEHIVDKSSKDFVTEWQKEEGASFLIDVRTPEEYEAGALKESLNIDVMSPDFVNNVQNLVVDKSQPIYLYCRSGGRSKKAAEQLEAAGYTHIINATDGYGKLRKYEK